MACLSTAISSPITKVERERESVDDEDDRNEDDDGDDDNHDDGDDDDDDDDDDSDDDAEGVKKIMMMTPICWTISTFVTVIWPLQAYCPLPLHALIS